MKKPRPKNHSLLRILISAIGLFVVLYGVDTPSQSIPYIMLIFIGGMGLFIAAIVFRRPPRTGSRKAALIPVREILCAILLGLFLNFVIPFLTEPWITPDAPTESYRS